MHWNDSEESIWSLASGIEGAAGGGGLLYFGIFPKTSPHHQKIQI